ncbi:MAG: LPS-assembly protein LptD, partial [Burkholderiales bacterium]
MCKVRLKSTAFLLLCIFSQGSLADEDALGLKLERRINTVPKQREATPLFIEADSIEGRDEEEITAQGSVVVHRLGQAVFADRLTYRLQEDEIEVEGNVRLEQHGNVVQGPKGMFNLTQETGFFDTPEFFLQEKHSRGNADKLFLEGPQQYRLEQAQYTTCPVGNDDWYIKAGDLKIDQTENIGTARNASIVFKGVPILYTPWINFPTSDMRKSGFLPPTVGDTSNNGFEFTLPYYWNIAPNYDATLSPRVMSKRGIQFNSEFRYLEPTYSGQARVDLLPYDQLKNYSTRSAVLLQHSQNFGNGLTGAVNFQR